MLGAFLEGCWSVLPAWQQAGFPHTECSQAGSVGWKPHASSELACIHVLPPRPRDKAPPTRGLQQQKSSFLTVLEARNLRSGCQRGPFPLRPLSLACRPSPCVFTWSSFCKLLCPDVLFL